MHRLRMSAWPGDVYLKSYRPSCTFFGYIPGFGPQKRSKAPFGGASRSIFAGSERRSADTAKCKMACFSHISPHGRSKLDDAIGKQSTRSIDAKRSLSECSMDHPSTARSEERWDRTFMVSVDTDDGAAHGAFGAFLGPKSRDVPKKTYDVVGDILDTLFLTTLTSAVYANSSSQQL